MIVRGNKKIYKNIKGNVENFWLISLYATETSNMYKLGKIKKAFKSILNMHLQRSAKMYTGMMGTKIWQLTTFCDYR